MTGSRPSWRRSSLRRSAARSVHQAVDPAAVPVVSAYGRNVVQQTQASEGPTHHIAADIAVLMDDAAEKKNRQAAE